MKLELYITKEQAAALSKLFTQYKLDEHDGDVSIYLLQFEPSSAIEVEFDPVNWERWCIHANGETFTIRERK